MRTPWIWLAFSACETDAPPKDTSPGDADTDTDTDADADADTDADYEDGAVAPFGLCKTTAPGVPITETTGTFLVQGRDDAPRWFAVGTWVSGTGSLNVVACVPSEQDAILDDLVLDLTLTLFDLDDLAIDLAIGDDATGVNTLVGTVTDWDEVTSWGQGSTFTYFERGGSSFSEVDKQGRLVGTVDVTQTDPPGDPLTITIDLTW